MLRYRLFSALAILPLVVASVWFGGLWFVALVAAVTAAGSLELYRLTAWGQRYGTLGLVLALVLVILTPNFPRWLSILMPWVFLPSFILLAVGKISQHRPTLARWAWAVTGALLLGGWLGLWTALRQEPLGREWVFLGLGTIFACDTAAYFVGRAWGRHRLAPTVSPRKTQEGAMAGFLGAIAAAFLIATLLFPQMPLNPAQTALLGGLIGIFAQLGDLAESWLKRRFQVKDSGNLIPGHGGMLDRLDSIVFTGIVLYYYVIWAVR